MNSPSEISSLVTRHTSPRRVIATFNAYHLGDNLLHLHFLRALAKAHPELHFIHGAHVVHHDQLRPVIADLPNLELSDLTSLVTDHTSQAAPPLNAWRGAEDWFYRQPDQHDFLQIHLRWFRLLADRMGLESPIRCARDMLFDYEALRASSDEWRVKSDTFDFLIVNSPPRSNQWTGFSSEGFAKLARLLHDRGETVITTAPTNNVVPCTQEWPSQSSLVTRHSSHPAPMSVTEIGALSTRARVIIGCVTGPMWPCFNVWNSGLPSAVGHPSSGAAPLRIHLLDTERVELTPNTVHTNSLTLVPEILKERGFL